MDDGRESEGEVDQDRRDALVKLGKFAIFTAPVVSALLVANKASALSCTVTVDPPEEVTVICTT